MQEDIESIRKVIPCLRLFVSQFGKHLLQLHTVMEH